MIFSSFLRYSFRHLNKFKSLSSVGFEEPIKTSSHRYYILVFIIITILLGIIIDSKLTWQSQIDAVCSRLARVIHLLRHLKSLVPKCFLKNAYYAFFHSVMTYGLTVWGNGSTINKVLKLQKSAIRILTGSSYDAHCRPLFRHINSN